MLTAFIWKVWCGSIVFSKLYSSAKGLGFTDQKWFLSPPNCGKKKQKYKISGPLKEVSQTENLKKQMKQDITHLAGLTK